MSNQLTPAATSLSSIKAAREPSQTALCGFYGLRHKQEAGSTACVEPALFLLNCR